MSNGNNRIRELGESLARAVEAASSSVVQVAAQRRASGTVWSESKVLTAAHVVMRSDTARVTLADGSRRQASVIGRDLATDVALLEVQGGGLSPIAFVDPASVAVGHLALALGRPGRQVRASLRMIGVVGQGVPTRAGARLSRWIETDRGLPEGFSGGPLLDADGGAIGMGTDGLVRGADLAIPRDELTRIVDEITTHGQVRRGWLGVAVNPVRLPQALADRLGQKSGALVIGVEEGGPADRAGLVLGDVIHAIDGAKVTGPIDLLSVLRARIDAELTIGIVRAGALEERKATTIARAA
jgi:S1-C subfamily serine protease